MHTTNKQTWLKLATYWLIIVWAPLANTHPSADKQWDYLNEQITANPNNPNLYLQRANLYILNREFDHALDDIAHADTYGAGPVSFFYKGLLHHDLAQYPQAIAQLNQFLAYTSDYPKALELRADSYQQLGNIKAAFGDYQQLINQYEHTNPGQYIAAAELAQVLGNEHGALAIIDQGLKQLGLTISLQHYAIALLRQQGDFKHALIRHQQLSTLMNNNPEWFFNYAQLLFEDHQYQQSHHAIIEAEIKLSSHKLTPWRKRLATRIKQLHHKLDQQQVWQH